ncbi:MAG: SDR family NAD(P)-dependent oxidoreductase [Planctomycetota bacterium]|nr:MAG: SDR family NAD(P)-dependent oxidoreductase [Planctomycetota bacterium]
MAKDNEAKNIVVSGASRGLGRAMLDGLAGAGHTVFGCSRKDESLAPLREQWPAPHGFDAVDVADDKAVARWADAVFERAGRVHLVVNNAGVINENAPLWEVSADEFARVIGVNVEGVANVVRHFVPRMIAAGGGVVVNMSSGWGRTTSADVAPYCASKWAVEGLTRGLAQDLPAGMAAVALNPGIIDTEMLRTCFGGAASSYPDPQDWATRAVPLLLGLGRRDNGKSLDVPGR